MAKLILETKYGNKVIRRDLPEDMDVHDILYRGDYIAMKLWQREDVAGILEKMGYEPTTENVDTVVNTGMLDCLNDCTDSDWEAIENAASYAMHLQKTTEYVYIAHAVAPDAELQLQASYSYEKVPVLEEMDESLILDRAVYVPDSVKVFSKRLNKVWIDHSVAEPRKNTTIYYTKSEQKAKEWLSEQKQRLVEYCNFVQCSLNEAAIKKNN